MEIVSVSAGMLSIPTVVIEVHVQPPIIKALGTIPAPTFPKGVVSVKETKKGDADEPRN